MAKQRPGKREREARKRRSNKRRTVVSFHNGSGWLTLKLGRKKLGRNYRKKYDVPF